MAPATAGVAGSGLKTYRWSGKGARPAIPAGAKSLPAGFSEVTNSPIPTLPTAPPTASYGTTAPGQLTAPGQATASGPMTAAGTVTAAATGATYDRWDATSCRAASAAGSTSYGYVRNHFSWCQWATYTAMSWGGGAITGTLTWRMTTIGINWQGVRRTAYDIYLDQLAGSDALANAYVGVSYGVWPANETPNASCNVQSGGGRADTVTGWKARSDAHYQMDLPQSASSVGPDKLDACFFGQAVAVWYLGAWNWAAPSQPNQGTWTRCDSAPYIQVGGVTYTSGCVFSYTNPFWTVSKTADPRISESAQHWYDAFVYPGTTAPTKLTKLIPGKYGTSNFMHRLYYNSTRIRANGDAAKKTCDVYFPFQTGGTTKHDCDEIPFARTYEGASVGDNNYSAYPVLSTDNQLSGSFWGAWLSQDRILDGDRFQIQITP
jgi:hypothetical protein